MTYTYRSTFSADGSTAQAMDSFNISLLLEGNEYTDRQLQEILVCAAKAQEKIFKNMGDEIIL
jgi:hypothetical protein